MGAFHAGHESLIRAARADSDEVVVSLFVNPAQFNDPRDLDAYPRDERRDARDRRAARRRRPLRPVARRGLPAPASRPRCPVAGPLRRLRGRPPRPGPLRRRLHRRGQAVQHGPARRGLLRPEGRAAGRGPARGWSRDLDFPLRDRGPAPPSASPTASRSRAATSGSSPGASAQQALGAQRRPARAPAQRGLRARGEAVLGRARRRARVLRRRRPRDLPRARSDLIVVAATIGATRLIDNVKAATPERRGADPKGAVSVLPTP